MSPKSIYIFIGPIIGGASILFIPTLAGIGNIFSNNGNLSEVPVIIFQAISLLPLSYIFGIIPGWITWRYTEKYRGNLKGIKLYCLSGFIGYTVTLIILFILSVVTGQDHYLLIMAMALVSVLPSFICSYMSYRDKNQNSSIERKADIKGNWIE